MTRTYPRLQPATPERADALLADPARQRVIDKMLAARTPEEIEDAFGAQHAWLVANPDDFGVLQAGELLDTLREALLDRASDAQPAPSRGAA